MVNQQIRIEKWNMMDLRPYQIGNQCPLTGG